MYCIWSHSNRIHSCSIILFGVLKASRIVPYARVCCALHSNFERLSESLDRINKTVTQSLKGLCSLKGFLSIKQSIVALVKKIFNIKRNKRHKGKLEKLAVEGFQSCIIFIISLNNMMVLYSVIIYFIFQYYLRQKLFVLDIVNVIKFTCQFLKFYILYGTL